MDIRYVWVGGGGAGHAPAEEGASAKALRWVRARCVSGKQGDYWSTVSEEEW